jgi:hypothetical protein
MFTTTVLVEGYSLMMPNAFTPMVTVYDTSPVFLGFEMTLNLRCNGAAVTCEGQTKGGGTEKLKIGMRKWNYQFKLTSAQSHHNRRWCLYINQIKRIKQKIKLFIIIISCCIYSIINTQDPVLKYFWFQKR